MTPPLDPSDVARFRELVRARTGMAPPESRVLQLTRAVQRAAAELGVADSAALYELVSAPSASGDALDALVSALNVSETHFFRDAGQMDALEQHILPELIARRRGVRRLRLWSAGCSTGEEPYTLAILLRRLLPRRSDWDVLILATDINGRSLERARRGIYRDWSLRGSSAEAFAPYVTHREEGFEVIPAVREMVTFAQLNLTEPVYPARATKTSGMDLILCRNVLMYFDAAARCAVIGRLGDALVDGGYLLTSRVEAALGGFEALASDAPGTAVYRKPKQARASSRVRGTPPPVLLEPPAVPGAVVVPKRAAPARAPVGRPPHDPLTSPQGPPSPATVDGADADQARREALRLWRTGEVQAAIREFASAAERFPLAAPLHYFHGLMLLDAGHGDEALVAFRRSVYADPECTLGHLALAGLFSRLGLSDRAGVALETAATLADRADPGTRFFDEDGPTVGEARELIAAQRALLRAPAGVDPRRG